MNLLYSYANGIYNALLMHGCYHVDSLRYNGTTPYNVISLSFAPISSLVGMCFGNVPTELHSYTVDWPSMEESPANWMPAILFRYSLDARSHTSCQTSSSLTRIRYCIMTQITDKSKTTEKYY